jgi:hypothetical protein
MIISAIRFRIKVIVNKTIPIKNGVKIQYLYFPQITIEKMNDTIVLYPHKQLLDDLELEKFEAV